MKKIIGSIVIVVFILCLAVFPKPQAVSAEGIGDGTWVLPDAGQTIKSSTIKIDTLSITASTWLKQMSEGIKISSPAKICYPFRSGQFHWVAKIMQVHDGKWVNVKTTTEYLYGKEAPLYACSEALTAGTFALFGYYNGPKESPFTNSNTTQIFTVGEWHMEVEGNSFGNMYAYDVNWNGYPTASYLAWGIKMCWDSECNTNPDHTIGVTTGYTYPQNYDATFMTSLSMGFASLGSNTSCQMLPYIELMDASNNVLAIIYYSDSGYADRCVS